MIGRRPPPAAPAPGAPLVRADARTGSRPSSGLAGTNATISTRRSPWRVDESDIPAEQIPFTLVDFSSTISRHTLARTEVRY